MKINSGFFAILLVFWMGGSTYWYVCKIKKDCEDKSSVIDSDLQNEKITEPETIELIPEIPVAINEPGQNAEEAKEEIIIKTKEKLIAGYTVYDFPKNSTVNNNISKEFDEFAEDLKLYLIENSQDKIIITGHTDDLGSDAANFKFGKKRALFIKSNLTKIGIPESHFIIKSKGEKEPLKSNETENGQTKNRRVVIKLSVN